MKRRKFFRKLNDTAQCTTEEVVEKSGKEVGNFNDAAAEHSVDESPTSFLKVAKNYSTRLSDASTSLRGYARSASNAGSAAAERVQSGAAKGRDMATSGANVLISTTEPMLASVFATQINELVQSLVSGSATIYDKAMDARYLETHVGGAQHRLFDGGHTIGGAFSAARSASPDDNIVQEALGTVQGLLRDVSTPMGLPIRTWDPDTYRRVAESLETNFGIPQSWFYDLNTFDAAELLTSSIGVVAVVYNWNRRETEDFAKMVGSMGVSATLSANPLLLILTVVAFARAFQRAHRTGEYTELVDGQVKGMSVAGASWAVVALVGVAGGPAGVALIASIVTGVVLNRALKNVSVVEISMVVGKQVVVVARELKQQSLERTCLSADASSQQVAPSDAS